MGIEIDRTCAIEAFRLRLVRRPIPVVETRSDARMDGRRTARCFARNESAAAAVEFAFIGLPLLAALVATFQIGLFFFSQSALEIATEKSARLVLTGTEQQQGVSQQQFLSTVCANLPSILNNCSNLMVDAQVYATFSSANTSAPVIVYNPNGTVANQWQYNLGGANSIVVMRVMYLLPVVTGPLSFAIANTGNGNRLLMATAVFKNEPYQ